MTLHSPLWMQKTGADPDITYAAVEDRLFITSLWDTEGVIAGGLKVSQRAAGANFSVDVAAGQAIITGDDVAFQGTYMVFSDAVANLSIPSPPGSGTRIHRVVAQIKDKLHNGSYSTYEWVLSVLQDTGSGTPAVPGSAYSLATVSVTAGQASVLDANIADTRFNALMRPNRPRLVGSDATRPAAPLQGELLFRTDNLYPEVYTGSAWKVIPVAAGPDLFVRKTSDTTRNNTAVLSADPHLTLSLAANATYTLDVFLIYQGASSASDIAISWTSPAGSALTWVPLGLTPTDGDQAPTQMAGYIRMPWTAGTTQRSMGTQTGNPLIATPKGIIRTSSSSGSLTLNWAQNTATVENTVVFTDSYIYARRVA